MDDRTKQNTDFLYQIAFYVKTVGQIKNLRPLCELTDEAGEGGPDPAPQKMKLSQKFRHLMRCKKYVNKICLQHLVPEILLFVYILEQNFKRSENT